MANNLSNIPLLPFKNNLVHLFSYFHTMNARHRRRKKKPTKPKKAKKFYMKIGDKLDGPILLGIIRNGFKFEKSAEKLMEESCGNCIGVCGLGLLHGRGRCCGLLQKTRCI